MSYFNVVVGYERFSRVRDAFLKRGFHGAVSIDIEEDTIETYGGPHLTGDFWVMMDAYCRPYENIELLIVFPPCTYVCGSGWHRNKDNIARECLSDMAIENAKRIMALPCKRIVFENPIGVLSRPENLGKPAQIIQPYMFGDDASKATCLWTKGPVPLLKPTRIVPPRRVMWNGKMRERWGNQTDSGQNRLGPSDDRATIRGKTYAGIADAMGEQYGRALRAAGVP